MQDYTNITQTEVTNEGPHKVLLAGKQFIKTAEEKGIPALAIYYIPGKGYKYQGILPQELENEEVSSEYDKFKEFLRLIIGFNKEDYLPPLKQEN